MKIRKIDVNRWMQEGRCCCCCCCCICPCRWLLMLPSSMEVDDVNRNGENRNEVSNGRWTMQEGSEDLFPAVHFFSATLRDGGGGHSRGWSSSSFFLHFHTAGLIIIINTRPPPPTHHLSGWLAMIII